MSGLSELWPRSERERQIQRSRKQSRELRVTHLAKKLTDRAKRQRKVCPRPLRQRYRKPKAHKYVAYDLETTRIEAGQPLPLYITAYGADVFCSKAVNGDFELLRDLLIERFLTLENNHARFCAWNGNNFDVYFIGLALLQSKEYVLRPYLTANKALRGLRVVKLGASPKQEWEFLDAQAMIVGNAPRTLRQFLETFAPEYQKLEAPDWDKERFDSNNMRHVEYAERDSEGLYHGLMRAREILVEHFEQDLQPTIGNLGIRIFQQHMPPEVICWGLPYEVEQIVRRFVMRGGYCYCARKYDGPVWKYDLNQAYAAAMREAQLPAGRCIRSTRYHPYAKCAIYQVTARKSGNRVPFYARDSEEKSVFALEELREVWLTSIEYQQLVAEKWSIEVLDGWIWDETFTMQEYVNKLERLRIGAPGGPKSAQGEMMKAIGNNSYGKTVESLSGLDIIMAAERPEGYHHFQDVDETPPFLWFQIGEPQLREYHQPQIGAFITAHVRMVLRRAILQAPDAWLYSDTDSCTYSAPVALPIDPGTYGLWKVEAEGARYRIITKKVYAAVEGKERKAKGMNIKRLTDADFERWYNGSPPKQRQVHRQNFLSAMGGAPMYVERQKVGQRVQ